MLTGQSQEDSSSAEVPSFQETLSCIKLTLKCNQHKSQSFENLNRRDKNNGEPVYFSFLTLSLSFSISTVGMITALDAIPDSQIPPASYFGIQNLLF